MTTPAPVTGDLAPAVVDLQPGGRISFVRPVTGVIETVAPAADRATVVLRIADGGPQDGQLQAHELPTSLSMAEAMRCTVVSLAAPVRPRSWWRAVDGSEWWARADGALVCGVPGTVHKTAGMTRTQAQVAPLTEIGDEQ